MDKHKLNHNQTVVCALYHFTSLPDFASKQAPLQQLMNTHELKGTLLLAREGLNGTIAGSTAGINELIRWLRLDDRFSNLKWKFSFDDEAPFYRAKVKLKKEIVTMGVEDIDPLQSVGTYVKPSDWDALISDPEVTVIDTRNEYEIKVGSFKHAINPHTKSFREFPNYVKENLDPKKNKKVAMYCTGGIRCEKSTAYLKQQGFEDVYHLEGGILKYLEEVPEDQSLWQGECFVFDNRVTVNHQLESGEYEQCHACRMPITPQEIASKEYEAGISCPHCINEHSEKQISRFKEREKQIQLAKQRGESHIGSCLLYTSPSPRDS